MKILVVGSGGREHALCWKLSQEAQVICTPGNPGIATVCPCFEVSSSNEEAIVQLCRDQAIDLVVVGPEAPLIDGLADRLRKEGIAVFGPGTAGANLEGSKAFSKEVMQTAGVPTAAFGTFTDLREALEFAERMDAEGKKLVVKASGNALGKGVIVCNSLEEVEESLSLMLEEKEFGEAGETVVLEERLDGPEYSLLTLCSGTEFYSLPVAQDYKRALEGDRGPNTGGMGTYSPVAEITPELVRQTEALVVRPLLNELAKRGIDYRGVLFSGLMLTQNGPSCLEYNVRFGDPETQSVMRRLGTGLAEAMMACARGEVIPTVEVKDQHVVTVVLVSEGYPGPYRKGIPIEIPQDLPEMVQVFHAGTATLDGKLVTNGGRVLNVTATGKTLTEARETAYRAAEKIEFEGKRMRSDIAAVDAAKTLV